MRLLNITYASLLVLLAGQYSLAETPFGIRYTPSKGLAVVVKAGQDPKVYASSSEINGKFPVEVRGQCVEGWNIQLAEIESPDKNTKLLKDASHDDRSLTPNGGAEWQRHFVQIDLAANQKQFAQECNAFAQETLQAGNTSAAEFYSQNHGLISKRFLPVKLGTICARAKYSNHTNQTWQAPPVNIPIQLQCAATPYAPPPLKVKRVRLKLQELDNQHSGQCELKMSGKVATNFPKYWQATHNSNPSIKYRYKYENAMGYKSATSKWFTQRMTDPSEGTFEFEHIDRIPKSIASQDGLISLELDTGDETFESKQKRFSLNCADALPLAVPTSHQLELRVEPVKSSSVRRGDYLCPTQVRAYSRFTAGDDFVGKMVLLGSGNLQVTDVDVKQGKTKSVVRTIGIPPVAGAAPSSLSGSGGSAQPVSVSITLGLNLANQSNQVIKQVAQKPLEFPCERISMHQAVEMAPSQLRGEQKGSAQDAQRKAIRSKRTVIEKK